MIDVVSVPNGTSVIASRYFDRALDLGAHLHLAAALAVVVLREIGDAAGRKIGHDAEPFSLEMIHRRAAEIVEIVREDFRREAHRDASAPSSSTSGTWPAG